jgi:hypothetical protein
VLDKARSNARLGTVKYWNVAIRYYLHIDPTHLSDEEWADNVAYLEMIRQAEKNN